VLVEKLKDRDNAEYSRRLLVANGKKIYLSAEMVTVGDGSRMEKKQWTWTCCWMIASKGVVG